MAFLAVGMYGKPLPPQNGGPVRLLLPWKYGFKSGKSLVRIRLTDARPPTFWSTLQPAEYGFWANVNPEVAHPRWSQATERLLGTGERVPTRLFNGYGPWVAELYGGADGSGALPVIPAGIALLAAALLLALLHGDTLGALVFALDGGLLPRLQAGVQRRLSPDLWEAVLQPLLVAPSALLPAVLGAALVGAGLADDRPAAVADDGGDLDGARPRVGEHERLKAEEVGDEVLRVVAYPDVYHHGVVAGDALQRQGADSAVADGRAQDGDRRRGGAVGGLRVEGAQDRAVVGEGQGHIEGAGGAWKEGRVGAAVGPLLDLAGDPDRADSLRQDLQRPRASVGQGEGPRRRDDLAAAAGLGDDDVEPRAGAGDDGHGGDVAARGRGQIDPVRRSRRREERLEGPVVRGLRADDDGAALARPQALGAGRGGNGEGGEAGAEERRGADGAGGAGAEVIEIQGDLPGLDRGQEGKEGGPRQPGEVGLQEVEHLVGRGTGRRDRAGEDVVGLSGKAVGALSEDDDCSECDAGEKRDEERVFDDWAAASATEERRQNHGQVRVSARER